MAEFTNGLLQLVASAANVLFNETPVCGNNCIIHRPGSGIVTLRGMTNQCRALYKVTFGANMAIPAGGTVGQISLAIAVDGEPLASATMIETPTAAEAFSNVFSAVLIAVPRGCCVTVGVRNTGEDPVDVQNANLIVERVA
ncbi:MAG: hypothetical protein IJ337_06695 [Clostridia bacterium]|nr:hypothetical protein [Clostridia bacterium]